MQKNPPPKTEQALLERCEQLADKTLGWLAALAQTPIPKSFHHAKGWFGQLIEWYLGADSASLSQPDFSHLGIELKTLPLNEKNEPKESTFVCTAPLTSDAFAETWENSRVRRKLAHVLWVPVEAAQHIPIVDRKIGMGLLRHLNAEDETILQNDWEELTEMLMRGEVTHISGKLGTYLHIRPKALHGGIKTSTVNEYGETIFVNPKGFYLRTLFTKKLRINA